MHFQLKFAGAALIGGPRRTTDEGWILFVLLPEGTLLGWWPPPSHHGALNFFYTLLILFSWLNIEPWISKGSSSLVTKAQELKLITQPLLAITMIAWPTTDQLLLLVLPAQGWEMDGVCTFTSNPRSSRLHDQPLTEVVVKHRRTRQRRSAENSIRHKFYSMTTQ